MKAHVYDDTHMYKGTNRLLIGIVFGVLTFWLFAQSLVNVVPAVQSDLHISGSILNLAISLTSLFSGIFIVVAGGFADKFGRMRITYIGLILSIVGSFCLVVTHGSTLLIIGRVIQGLSAACIMPATMALVKTYYDGKERQRALSFWSIGSWGGSGVCSFAGGAIATYLGWRWIFIFSIVIALLGILLIAGTPESKVTDEQTGSFDYKGLIAFIPTMLALNIAISKGSTIGWSSKWMLILVIVFAICAFFFFKFEQAQPDGEGFIDFSLFKNRYFSGATLSNFLLNAAAGTMIVINTYAQIARGFTAFQSGMLSLGYLVCVLLSIRVGERLLQKMGARKPMISGSLIAALGIAFMMLTFIPGILYAILAFIGYALFGLGLGIYATPSTDTAVSNVPEDKAGVASGIYKMASSLGGSFGAAISAALFEGIKTAGHLNLAASVGLFANVVFCIASVLSVLFLIPKSKDK